MTPITKDFYGKEVAEAIQKACKTLKVPQEQLDIEVVETGSTGIFGLIRKKAHIKVVVKGPEDQAEKEEEKKSTPQKSQVKANKRKQSTRKPTPAQQQKDEDTPQKSEDDAAKSAPPKGAGKESTTETAEVETQDSVDDGEPGQAEPEELTEEILELVRQELSQMLELMGYPSPVEVSAQGTSVLCHVGDEHEEILTGQDGKTLDSIQYLLRKIVVRKVPNRLRVSVDIGNYREKRLAGLKEQAIQLAEQVKSDGKTQVITALSPSERRVIHMSLQDDKEIRSRSVGDGLFKKILIYKPGKGNKSGGRRRSNSRGRRNNNNGRKKSD